MLHTASLDATFQKDINIVLNTLRTQYADFTGRTRRREFWLFTLATVVLGALLTVLLIPTGALPELLRNATLSTATLTTDAAQMQSPGMVIVLVVAAFMGLALVIPTLAISARRLQDRNLSSWWLLLYLLQGVPVLGTVINIGFLVVFALPGTPGPNRFGQNPKGDAPQLQPPPTG